MFYYVKFSFLVILSESIIEPYYWSKVLSKSRQIYIYFYPVTNEKERVCVFFLKENAVKIDSW